MRLACAARLFGSAGAIALFGPDDLSPVAMGVWRLVIGAGAVLAPERDGNRFDRGQCHVASSSGGNGASGDVGAGATSRAFSVRSATRWARVGGRHTRPCRCHRRAPTAPIAVCGPSATVNGDGAVFRPEQPRGPVRVSGVRLQGFREVSGVGSTDDWRHRPRCSKSVLAVLGHAPGVRRSR